MGSYLVHMNSVPIPTPWFGADETPSGLRCQQTIPDAASLARFSLDDAAPSETALEDRISHIRSDILPPFTEEPLPPPILLLLS